MDQSKASNINYGRPSPPVETRWKPGQSGNPKGRPRKEESIADMLKELLYAVCPTDPERRRYAELIVRALVHQGAKGNLGAIKEVFNRLVGRVPFLIERIGGSNEPNQKSSRYGSSVPPGTRVRLTLEEKNDILAVLGIEPIGKQANPNQNATGRTRG